jgi:hypothetical protein
VSFVTFVVDGTLLDARETASAEMIRPDFKKVLLDQQGAAVILWAFFTISIALYIVIGRWVVQDGDGIGSASLAGTLRALLWALVLIDLGYLVWWKKHNLSRQALLAKPSKAKILRALEQHTGRVEQRAAAVISTYVTRKIVGFAIIEAVAVYGLLLAVVGGHLEDQYVLSALSLLLLALEFPRNSVLVGLVNEIETQL